jgi:type I restriction enzyme S subunit
LTASFNDLSRLWLGPLPKYWVTAPLRAVLAQKVTDGPHETPEFINEGVPFLSVDGIQDGELVFEACRFISRSAHETYARKVLPRKDDILLGKAASTGKIARVKTDVEFGIWSPLALLRPARKVHAPFLEYALKTTPSQAQIHVLCTSNTQQNISMADIPRIMLPLPPPPAQKAIADYLDAKTAAIDALIEKKRKLLDLLAEERAALINQAVTKGLDPTVPMKDSGMPWIGEIPAHWEISALRWIRRPGTSITYGIVQAGPDVEDGVPYIRVSEMAGEELPREGYQRTSREIDQAYARSRVYPGDLVVAIRASVGKVLKVPPYLPVANLTQGTAKVSVRQEVSTDYVYWALKSDSASAALWFHAKGATFKEITLETLRKVAIALPPRTEQDAIAARLSEAAQRFDDAVARVKRQINRLQEYRQALITAAVTGQLDIEAAA